MTPLDTLASLARHGHAFDTADGDCPLSESGAVGECTCGARERNAQIDAALSALRCELDELARLRGYRESAGEAGQDPGALAACVEALTEARDRIARDGHVPGDEEGCEHCAALLHVDRALALARAGGRVVATVEVEVNPPGAAVTMRDKGALWLSCDADEHPALAALPVGARVRVVVVADAADVPGDAP